MVWWRESASSQTLSLPQTAGLEVENGIIVDAFLRTAIRISTPQEMLPHSTALRWASASASSTRTTPTPWAVGGSEHGGQVRALSSPAVLLLRYVRFGYEAVGEVDASLETFADWKRPNEEGVIYYLPEPSRARCVAVECVGAG